MKSITKSLKDIAVLTISLTLAFILALAANFAYGEWSNPPLSPPTSNVPAPLNEGWDLQIKSGRLGAQYLNAFNVSAIDTMRAPEYCDAFGANCVNAAQLYNLVYPPPTPPSNSSRGNSVTQSGTHGQTVTVWNYPSTGGPRTGFDRYQCNDGTWEITYSQSSRRSGDR